MKTIRALSLACAGLLVSCAFSSLAAPTAVRMAEPKFRIGRMPAPTIDGRVDGAEWAKACETRHFLGLGGDKAFCGEAAFWFGRDGKNFYFAAVCAENPNGGLVRKSPARNGNTEVLWDDNFEFVWVPDMNAEKPDVCHLMVNANGAFFGQGQKAGQMVAWGPKGFRTASQCIGGKWHFELMMPLATVGFDKTPNAEHGIRICKTWKRVGSEWGAVTCFSPYVHGFFSASACPRVTFDDEAPVVQLKALGGGEADTVYPAELTVENASAAEQTYRVVLSVRPKNSQGLVIEETLALKPGERKDYRKEGPVQGDEAADVKVAVTSADGTKTHYLREFVFQPKAPQPKWMAADGGNGLEFQFAYFPTPSLIHVLSDVSALKEKDKIASLRFRVLTKAGEEVCVRDGKPDAKGVLDLTFPVPDLAPLTRKSGSGDYVIEMAAVGLTNDVVRQQFERNVFEWEGNRIGLSDTVVEPFTPLRRERLGQSSEVRGQTAGEKKVGGGVGADHRAARSELEKISVVLRDHIVDRKTGLWQQVIAQGKPLLARPMRIVEIKKVGRESRSTEDGKFHCSPSPSTFTFSSLWDYDGMMEWKLTLAPGHYEPMSLEIPIRAERAPLMHACTDGLRFNYAGEVPAGAGVVWDGSKAPRSSIIGDYVPYIWVGGPLRGIAVFGENDKGWVLGREQKLGGESRSTEEGKVPLSTSTSSLLSCSCPCQEILREADGTVVIRLNLIQCAVDLTEARTIRIGFQATPVKPMLPDWREIPPGDLVGCCLYWGGYEDSHAVCPYDEKTTFWEKMAETRRTGKVDGEYVKSYCRNWPSGVEPTSNVHSQRLDRASRHYWAGMSVMKGCYNDPKKETVWYTNGRGVHYGLTPGRTFADEWCRLPFLKRPFTIRSMAAYDLDPVASFRDHAAWWWAKAFKLGVMDHLYWDDVFCQSTYDVETTDAYRLPDGSVQPASGIFNMRAQVRRGALVAAECGKKPTGNWIHMTNTAMAPVSAFAGVHYDWEDPGSSAPFQERYSRAYMQACTIGRQMGCRVALMGYFAPTTPERLKWLRRTGVGPTLTHECRWYRPKEVSEALKAFGYRQPGTGVKVWNYWDEDVPFPVAIDGIEWSALAMARKAVQSSEFKVQSSEFKVQSSEFKVQSSELRVQSSKFRVQSSEAEVLIIVCNYENREATARVKPDCAVLGLKPDFKAYDAETGAELAVKDGVVTATLAKYDFILIRLR